MKKTLLLACMVLISTVIFAQNGRQKSATPKEVEKSKTERILIKSQLFKSDRDDPTDTQVIPEDLVVQGSIALGVDAPAAPSFGFNTMLFTENNLRIHFDDNSASSSFPNNDWTIEINESANGGTNHFAIVDATAAATPFKILAGAGANALFIDENGRVGLGNSNPAVELHVNDGDTPTLRLDQDGTSGWTPQSWDVAGNESNFFIRDVTNGSSLVFRIKPGAPTNSFYINDVGSIGLGNDAPQEKLDVTGNIKLDSLMKFTPLDSVLGTPAEGYVYMDKSDHKLKYFDSTEWIAIADEQELDLTDNDLSISGGNTISLAAYMDNTDEQDLVAATLTGTMLEIEIENGASVTVDLFPLIEDLEARVTAIEEELGIGGVKTEKAQLYQNVPNPADGNTEIPYFIPSSFKDAYVMIYNAQGVKVKEVELNERGRKASVKLIDSEFETGTYYYTLVIDGKRIDAKSMIII